MHLFYQEPQPDLKRIHENASKAQGTQYPERVLGYEGAFLFTLLDVYVTDKVKGAVMNTSTFKDKLNSLLLRFKGSDYGHVTAAEEEHNQENRWLSCSHCWTIGRYDTELGLVVFEAFNDLSLLYFEGEDISVVRKQQDAKVLEAERIRDKSPWWLGVKKGN